MRHGPMLYAWMLLPSLALAAPEARAPEPSNPHLGSSLTAFRKGRLKAADEELRAARASEHNTPADEIQIQVLDGMLRAVSADDALARAAFNRALKLNPDVALPDGATKRARKMFNRVREEFKARAESRLPIASEVAKLCSEGKLAGAEALLADTSARKDLTEVQTGQLSALKGLVLILKGLEKAGHMEANAVTFTRSAERQLKAAEEQLASNASTSLTEAESGQQLVLKRLFLVVKGMVRAESGDEAQARAAFAQAFDLDPGTRAPPLGTDKVQRLFAAVRATVATQASMARDLPARIARIYADGKLEQAELLLVQEGERLDLTQAEAGQLSILRGQLLVLKGLERAGPGAEERSRVALGSEGELKDVEEQIAAMSRSSLTETESVQLLRLKNLYLATRGVVKAESGDKAQARAAFEQALELDPKTRLFSLAAPKVRQLFDAVQGALPPAPPAKDGFPAQVARLFSDGRLERAELLLAEQGERTDLTKVESGQLFVLKELLQTLKSLPKTIPGAEGRLKLAEERYAAEAIKQPSLESLLFMVRGLVLTESGKEKEAKAAFALALKLDPTARLPAAATARANHLFDEVKAPPAPAAARMVVLTPPRMVENKVEPPVRQTGGSPPPNLRAWAWAPAVGGVVLEGSGVMFYLMARANYGLINPNISSAQELHSIGDAGRAYQTAAFALAGAGAVALGSAAAMYLWGKPSSLQASVQMGVLQ